MSRKSKLNAPIENYYKLTEKKQIHNPGYPQHLIEPNFRMLVVAASGGGKTMFLCELIHRTSGTFEEIIICLRSKHEPLYEMLEKRGKGMIKFYENTIPDINEYKTGESRLIVFDDLILDKKLLTQIGEYFVRSRKYNMSVAFLSQSFYGIPKLIRLNANYIVLKKIGSDRDVKAIIRDYSLDMPLEQLMKLYRACTKEKTNFLMIDLQNDAYKYRQNFVPIDINS